MYNFKYKILPNLPIYIAELIIDNIYAENIELIRIWRNQQKEVLRQEHEISPEKQIKYFRESVWSELDSLDPSQILLSINMHETLIGYGGFVHINWENLEAEISFLLKTEITKEIEEYSRIFSNFLACIELIGRDYLKLKKLTLETYEFRRNHIQVIEDSGYTRVAVNKIEALTVKPKYNSISHYKELKTSD